MQRLEEARKTSTTSVRPGMSLTSPIKNLQLTYVLIQNALLTPWMVVKCWIYVLGFEVIHPFPLELMICS